PAWHGILVQLPLPKHIDEEAVLLAIDPEKDVDGFHPLNMGRLWSGHPVMIPSTPAGIMEMFHEYGIDLEGKNAVVIGGMNRDENGKLCGDVDYEAVAPLASHITPVPGG
ncbi:tetrahydrofolate dehydrogenase/cyclohydrolase catalytic domain-containing protein, partial [Streptococcus pneumoniae]|uniref:tetrahydrofolate dehydrogenase/cyclohydrolase catalytic domain-containing protein n=1 Tax=Streptococcus pneumoniae TaxID=1313 RepID=UPI000AEF0DEB